ncbi:hypothetical protein [Ferrovibrio terrae]|uniref:portal protein n=1 Tax=Ferrovibrio terrae TaxID=2594003 RepID=UPI0031376DF7
MRYGPTAPRGLPVQDPEKLLLLADRWARATAPHDKWAEDAKKCVDYVEGRQWAENVKRSIERQGRPVLTFNEIFPLVRLVLGYHRNNRNDTRAIPGYDGTGEEKVAEAISRVFKQTAEQNQMSARDAEVFGDGIMTGRGFYDTRLDFSENDFGEIKTGSRDPFRVKVDPDLDDYDLDKGGFVIQDEWACIDQVRDLYGQQAADLVSPLTRGNTSVGPIINTNSESGDVHPIRSFGLEDNDMPEWWGQYNTVLGDYTDPLRKSIRVLEFQYWQATPTRVFVDLETGDRSVIPDHWNQEKIGKALYFAEQRGNPLFVRKQMTKRVRWTTIIGDLIVYDDWSPYDGFTLKGYFSWFRRGFTRGMVHDLISPQDEINKRHMAGVETVMRTANSGWMYQENSLDPVQERQLKNFGSAPGINIKFKGEKAPTRITPVGPSTGHEWLETNAEDKMRRISGVNEAALGENDKVQSGRALEAKQRQAVISLQVYMDNFKRTKELVGRQWLNMVQKHYTEKRIFRILGEDGKFMQTVINDEQRDPATGLTSKLNDVTAGKYSVQVDEAPLAASFANAQFEEALMLAEKMKIPPQAILDIIIDLSSIPRKEEVKGRMQTLMGTAAPGAMPGGQPGAMPGQPPESLVTAGTPAGIVTQLPVGQPQPAIGA